MENRVDTVLWPGWDIVRLIGRGSFGVVYEIERQVGGQKEKAALKVITIPQNKESEILALRSDGYDDASITSYFKESCLQFEKEYAMMAGMKGNSHIVYCDDLRIVQHDDGFGWNIYIKMELLTPLKNYLPQSIPQEQVIRLGMDMCSALEECQRRHIVHRDIKPGNIFVSRDGTYKLGDFGIARTMEQTMGGTKVGTYEYMAPEVYNNQPYGTGADIYSVGLVLYWMLNDRTGPFTAPGAPPSQREKARVRRYSGEPLPAPAHGSDKLKKIVLKACAFDQKDRYTDPARMRQELEALLYGQTAEKKTAPKEEKELRIKYYVQGEDGLIREEYGTTKNPLPLEGRKVIMMTVEHEEDEEKTTEAVPQLVPTSADKERTTGVNYAPVQERITPEPVAPIIPEPYSNGEITQGVWGAQTNARTEEEASEPRKSRKNLFIVMGAAIAILVLVLALASSSASAQTASTPTLRPTFRPTAESMEVGDCVTFGRHEQEPIEWLVLDVQDGKMLLISKNALATEPYDNRYKDVTWQSSTIRDWLNDDFLDTVFTSEEQSKILTTTVYTPHNSEYGTAGGNNTTDKVFLLSIEEANKYLAHDERKCTLVYYDKLQWAYKDNCVWWLRSPGYSRRCAAVVLSGGDVDIGGYSVSDGSVAVRPAMWVEIDALD